MSKETALQIAIRIMQWSKLDAKTSLELASEYYNDTYKGGEQ